MNLPPLKEIDLDEVEAFVKDALAGVHQEDWRHEYDQFRHHPCLAYTLKERRWCLVLPEGTFPLDALVGYGAPQ